MARTSLSQRVVVNINMMEFRRKTRKPRKKQTQIQLTRQSGLRMIPSMYPVYINPSVSQNPLASYAGTHLVDPDIRLKPSQIEHPGLTTRQPVMPDPEAVTPVMAVASHSQHQSPPTTPVSVSSVRRVRNPLTGQMVNVGSTAYRNAFQSGYFNEDLEPLPGKEEIARRFIEKYRKTK
jgi:hypothetical protein